MLESCKFHSFIDWFRNRPLSVIGNEAAMFNDSLIEQILRMLQDLNWQELDSKCTVSQIRVDAIYCKEFGDGLANLNVDCQSFAYFVVNRRV